MKRAALAEPPFSLGTSQIERSDNRSAQWMSEGQAAYLSVGRGRTGDEEIEAVQEHFRFFRR